MCEILGSYQRILFIVANHLQLITLPRLQRCSFHLLSNFTLFFYFPLQRSVPLSIYHQNCIIIETHKQHSRFYSNHCVSTFYYYFCAYFLLQLFFLLLLKVIILLYDDMCAWNHTKKKEKEKVQHPLTEFWIRL